VISEFKVNNIMLSYKDGSSVKLKENYIAEPCSKDIRGCKVKAITVKLD
jgi:hypothetical protein